MKSHCKASFIVPSFYKKHIIVLAITQEQMEPEKPSILIRGWLRFKETPPKPLAKLRELVGQAIKMAKDDPRRLIHSLKVGLALTLVSLLYYLKPLYCNFGASAMWAIMTVVVVFEFSVGMFPHSMNSSIKESHRNLANTIIQTKNIICFGQEI